MVLKGLASGYLDRRVTIQVNTADPDTDQDDWGGLEPNWSDLATVWAHIEPVSGRESWHADHLQADVTHIVTTRYQSSFAGVSASSHRLLYGTRYFGIKAVRDLDERHAVLVFLCEEQAELGEDMT